jgi:hypothetical protein
LRGTGGSGKRVPGSAIRKLEKCLAERGMNGCMNLDVKEIFERCNDRFKYGNEKPLYGVIGRALKRGAVYQIKTSSGEIMLCSRKTHVKTLLSLLEDIYLERLYGGVFSERREKVRKFETKIPDIEKSRYLTAVAQHLLSYPNIYSILMPDYRAIENAVRTGYLEKICEMKKRLSLKDLNEAVRSLYEGMLNKCRVKALSIHPDLNIAESLALHIRDAVFSLIRGGVSSEAINRSAESIRSSFNLPPEKLPEVAKAIKELYDLFKDVIPLYDELVSRLVETYKKLEEEVYKVIREVLDEGDLKGKCFICGEVHYEDEAELLKSVLE